MAIPIVCACGARIRAKDKLAGKRVTCPSCGEKLAVPGLPHDHTSTSTTADVVDKIEVQCECGKLFRVRDKYAGKRGKCPHCGVIVAIPWPELTEDDLLSDVGELPDTEVLTLKPLADDDDLSALSSEPTHPTTCPSCNASLPPDAVLCLACGYHTQTGQRFKSVVEASKEHVPDLPKGITVEESDSELVITALGASQSGTFVVYFFLVIPLLLLFVVAALLGGPFFRVGVALLVLGILGLIAFLLVASSLNRRVIRVNSKYVVVRNEGPIPWPNFAAKMPVNDIRQLYVVEKWRMKEISGGGDVFGTLLTAASVYSASKTGFFTYFYHVNVILKNGWRRKLMLLGDRRSARFIERKIERFLSVKDVPVVSTWYQSLFLREKTKYDELEIEQGQAMSAKSLPLPIGVLIPLCLVVFLFGSCVFSSMFAMLGEPAKPDAATVKKHMTPDESPTVVALKEGTNVEDDFSGEALEPRWKCYADNGLIVEESDGVAKIHGMAPSSTGRYVNVGFELAHAITAGSFEAQIDVLALSGTFGGENHRQRSFGFHAIGSNDRRVGLQYWADQYRISHDDGRQYAPSNGDEMNEFHQWRIVYDAVGKTASVFVDDRQIGDTVMVDLGDSFTLKVGLSCNKNVHIEGHFDNFRLIGK